MSQVIEGPNGALFHIEIIATGEVRDAEGNLVNQNVELAGSTEVDSVQLLKFLEGMK